MRKEGRNILFIFIGVALCAFVIGYGIWNKPHSDVKDADAVETDAISLYNSFISDSAKAKSAFLNKIIKVSGEVQKVLVNQQQQQIILLKTSVSGASVNCTMEQNRNKIKQGDKVVLKGICSGYINGDTEMGIPGDVFLIRCYPST
jgi:putative nucleic acid binding protein